MEKKRACGKALVRVIFASALYAESINRRAVPRGNKTGEKLVNAVALNI